MIKHLVHFQDGNVETVMADFMDTMGGGSWVVFLTNEKPTLYFPSSTLKRVTVVPENADVAPVLPAAADTSKAL